MEILQSFELSAGLSSTVNAFIQRVELQFRLTYKYSGT